MAQVGEYDLILMDIQMPELDGLDATRAIRAWEADRNEHRLIVAMTAHALQGDRERCLSAGMDDYLTKPIRSEQLFQLLERVAEQLGSDRCTPLAPAAEESAPANDVPPPAPQNGVIDWKHALSVAGGDQELLDQVAEAFCEESPLQMKRLRDCYGKADWPRFERAAHTLKSAFATFGVTAGQTCAAALEWECKRGQPPTNDEPLDVLERHLNQAIGELQDHLQSTAPVGTI
jgi:two-component system sensor histidine kinase/response regulator